ncbi:MAG: hypothetical protein R3179_04045 [Sedimenticolaceae bacterium]|nr:hypothetical protein [Sedimenticolaceae bacterium]
MKTLIKSMMAVSLLAVSASASAFFWDDDDDWKCWGIPDCNPYDEWDPRYWMEEMEQAFDDDDDYGYGGGPWGRPMMPGYGGYGMPYGGYPGYGYGYPQYQQPAYPQYQQPAYPQYQQPAPAAPQVPQAAPAPAQR